MSDIFAPRQLYLLIRHMAATNRKKTPGSGRKKRSPNKVTAKVRDAIKAFSEDNFVDFQKTYRKLSPRDKCKIYVDLLSYSVPKLAPIDLCGETSTSGSISRELKQMANETLDQENTREK